MECVFDLIDNSIDAARDRIMARGAFPADQYGLPADYSGYRIDLRFSKDAFEISDDCGGIEEATLTRRAFVVGSTSSHDYGIGWFGIGLKRALLKLGRTYTISTDTGDFAARLSFAAEDLGQGEGELTADVLVSSGRAGTTIRIEGLNPGARHEFGGSWTDGVPKHLSRRYGLYVKKGLAITVEGAEIAPFGPGLREEGPVPLNTQHFSLADGMEVYVDSGMHESYRIKGEDDDWRRDTELTDQYGWYFACNDRIIRSAAHDEDIGFTANWHPEYYGFVGWVRFVSKDAEHLPWDTKKTAIDLSSNVFQQIKGKLQKFADAYRTDQRKARRGGEEEQSKGGKSGGKKPGKGPGGGKEPPKPGVGDKPDPEDHNENWSTLLPASLRCEVDHSKLTALVYEAKALEVARCYAGSMLYRALMEAALFEHLKKSGRYADVRESYFQQQEDDDRALTAEQKKGYRPTFRTALDWLNRNDDYFPTDVRRECVTARNKFGKHLQELNGVVHEGDLTNSAKLKIARDDTLPLLKFLLTKPAAG